MLKKILSFELKGRPVIILFTLIFMFIGAVLGMFYLPEDWSQGRKMLAGVLGGFGSAMIVVTSRMVGAYGETKP